MSDLNLPKLFNHELNSIYQSKPPVSRAKMASITKQALNAVKYYKHVVIAVEKFIAKCRPEYKLPGLYVIDSIVRQSQYQHGNKDVYGPRFSKNFQTTFENLFQCREEDKPKIVRVLNLWQKNDIYAPDIIQPLMKLASENRGSFGGESSASASFNHSQTSATELAKKPSTLQSFQSSSAESAVSKGASDPKGNSDAAMIIQQQQQKIEELMQQQQQLLQAQALQSLLGQNPVLAAAAAAVAVKDKADNSIVTLLQEQQNQLNQLETLKNQLSSQFEPPAPEPVPPPKPYKESTTLSGHPTEFNKALLDDFDYSDEEEDMTQRIQRQREQVEQQQTRLQDSSSAPDVDMLAQLQEQFRRNEHEHIMTGGVGSTDLGRVNTDGTSNDDSFHAVSSLPSMIPVPPPSHLQQPPLPPPHHRHHEPPPAHLPPRRSLSPEPFPPLPPHRRNQPPLPPHFENEFPPPPQQRHDNMYPMPPPPAHRGGSSFHDNHPSPPPPRFNDDPFYHGDHRFPTRERRRSRSPIPPPGGRSRSPLPPPPRGRSRSPLPPPGRSRSPLPPPGRSRSPLPLPGGRSRSPPRGRSRSPHPPGGRSRRWDRDSRGRRSRSPRSRSPLPIQQPVRGYPHNTWEPTHPELEPQPPPPPPKVEWRGKEIPSPKSKRYTVCSTTIWVGRLPKGITKQQLDEAFQEFGPINSIEMVIQRGCAYVCMVYRSDTVRARNGLMNTKIGGSYCKLAWAPGKGVKGPDYKSYWSAEDGASFIPWDLVKEDDLEELAVGGVIDPNTYPPGVKHLPPPKAKEEKISAPLPKQDQDSVVPAPPTTSIAAPPTQQPPPMAPQMMTNIPPPPIPPPQQSQTFQPPMSMQMPLPPGAPMGMMPPPPPAGPFGATPPSAHMQGPPPPMGGPPPNMRPPFSQPGPPQQFSAPMVSPTFGGGHQMEMQFGAPQVNMQHVPPPPGGGHQMEMLRQPPPTSIPPSQMNSNQFPVPVGNQNPTPDLPGEHQMESQKQEQESDTTSKPVEPSSAENDDSDKMDICDTWEQEKVQRLAEEVEKFEQEVMNIERNSMKASTDNNAASETTSTTQEAERTVDNITEHKKESVDETKKEVSDLAGHSKGERESKNVIDGEVTKIDKADTNRQTGENDGVEAKKDIKEVDNNPLTSELNTLTTEGTDTAKEEREQTKAVDEKPPPAEKNEATSFDDAMDLQDSSPEPSGDPSQQLTTDDA